MSIHATLSPEAQERLNAQQRNSTISSAIIAILSVVLIALALSIVLLPQIFEPSVDLEAKYIPAKKDEPDDSPPVVDNSLQRKPTPPAPSSAQLKAIAAQTLSPVSIPVPDVMVTAPSLDFGDGDDFGPGGLGDGLGSKGFEGIPDDMRKRCSPADRMARLLSEGGTEQCEDAVVKALDWLQATQKPDGSWTNDHPVAMTGLALLAYLGHCETPQSPQYGETVLKGITYLIDIGMKNDGRLSNKDATSIQWVYDHGIATYALAEAYTFCSQLKINIPNLDTVTKQAGDMIFQGQNDVGGWVYKFASSDREGDNSVGFWQIQALKACKHTGLWPNSKFTKPAREALAWLEKAQGTNGAIGYRGDPNRSPGLTGGGVLAFQMWDKGGSSAARKGVKYVAENSEFEWGQESSNLYYHYYNAQAMINHGGKEWKDYNLRFRDSLLKAQNPDGSWTQAGIKHGPVNTHMATCLSTLMLEVYYRFLPGTGGK